MEGSRLILEISQQASAFLSFIRGLRGPVWEDHRAFILLVTAEQFTTREADKGGADHIQIFVLVMLSEPTEEEKAEIQKQQPKVISSLVLLS